MSGASDDNCIPNKQLLGTIQPPTNLNCFQFHPQIELSPRYVAMGVWTMHVEQYMASVPRSISKLAANSE